MAGVGLWQPWQTTRVSGRGRRRAAGGVPTLAPVRSQRRPSKNPEVKILEALCKPMQRRALATRGEKTEKQKEHRLKENEYVGYSALLRNYRGH